MILRDFITALISGASDMGVMDDELAGIGCGQEHIPGKINRHYYAVKVKRDDAEMTIEITESNNTNTEV